MNDKEKTKPCIANCFNCDKFRPAGIWSLIGIRSKCAIGGCKENLSTFGIVQQKEVGVNKTTRRS